MEPPFDELDGVLSTTSGFTGGPEEAPTYQEVVRGETGHTEAVQVIWDPARISYAELLAVFWPNVDPVDGGGQFCDRGPMYRPGIFPKGDEQQALALASRDALATSGVLEGQVAVEVTEATAFWPAEEYHQAYYLKNPVRYRAYRTSCRRDARLDEVWGSERAVPPAVLEALGLQDSSER
ncbi:MAG: peptide-methionine (S)-S-oxide reductase [Gemmatimonadales bacterium]|nr:MAG: peptide-methionine (S)-S-oxide reductase [Gemmatimonadales bacterium]